MFIKQNEFEAVWMFNQWVLYVILTAALLVAWTIKTIRTFSWTNDQIESFLQKKVSSAPMNKKIFYEMRRLYGK